MNHTTVTPTLLAEDEPRPFRLLNPDSVQPLLLVCDHAGARLPRALGSLGLEPATLRSHLALDLGAEAVTLELAARLGATAVLASYSRLAIDLNRDTGAHDLFLSHGDGVSIPGNAGLSDAQRNARVQALYQPYHTAVARQIQRLATRPGVPLVVSVHSFTPVFEGVSRPWEFGVLWNSDPQTGRRLIEALRAEGWAVGDNQPYSGKDLKGYTLEHHAARAHLPHVLVEIRQDLLEQPAQTLRVTATMERAVRKLLAPQPAEAASG